MLYCVRFKSPFCGVGYIRPWNSVRDGETYSLTYLPTSFINGIEVEQKCSGKILRHKLRFNGMVQEFFRSGTDNVARYGKGTNNGISTIHQLYNPEIILGFEKLEDAQEVSKRYLYVGQRQYMVFPCNFYEDSDDGSDDLIVEMTDEEFSKLRGSETFPSDENDEEAVYCGNNRQNGDERMYLRIVRTK